MRKRILLLPALLLALVGCQSDTGADPSSKPPMTPAQPATKPVALFGTGQQLADAPVVPVQAVLADPHQWTGKHVKLTGIVESVCPAKGCWLRVCPEPGAGTGDVFVKFVDPPEGRLVPMEAVGHDITVEGVIKDGKMSEAQARHLKQDAGASQAELDAIVGPQPQVMVGNPVALIEGLAVRQ